MAKTVELAVKIVSDARQAAAGITDTESRISRLGKAAGAAAVTGLAVAGTALVALGVSAVKGAANLEQSIGAVDAVFKTSAAQMHTWADGAATDVGLTKNEFNELGTLIGAQLKNGGTAMDQLAPKTRELIRQGADMSAMFGGTTADAVAALSSALKGERDPIERYGVSLNQAKIDAEAAALGFTKVGGALSSEASQAATLSLIMKQTADAHGAFAREGDTLANQQQVLTAEISNLKDTLGVALLPIIVTVVSFLNSSALPVLKSLLTGFTNLIGGAAGASSALSGIATTAGPMLESIRAQVGPLITAFGSFITTAIIPTATAIGTALAPIITTLAGTVLPAMVAAVRTVLPPLAEAVTAIGGLVSAIAARLQPVIQALLPVVQTVFRVISANISAALGVISAIIRTVTAVISGDWSGAWAGIRAVVTAVWNFIRTTISGALSVIRSIMSAAMQLLRSLVSSGWEAIKTATTAGITGVVGFIKGLPSRITGALGNLSSLLTGAGRAILDGLLRGLVQKFEDVKNFVGGIGSWIADHKGPISYDRTLLEPAGAAIMGGLIRSLQGGIPDLEQTLSNVTKTVAATRFGAVNIPLTATGTTTTPAGASRPTPTPVNITFTGLVADPAGTAQQILAVLRAYGILIGPAT